MYAYLYYHVLLSLCECSDKMRQSFHETLLFSVAKKNTFNIIKNSVNNNRLFTKYIFLEV